jgi:peptide methionine sulfoxide reductase MsrA
MGHIYDVMDILYTTGKGKFMDTVERFHIYKETRKNNQINDKNTVKRKAIFHANSQDPREAHAD